MGQEREREQGALMGASRARVRGASRVLPYTFFSLSRYLIAAMKSSNTSVVMPLGLGAVDVAR